MYWTTLAKPKKSAKNVGDDLAEGKPTLPLIYLMRNGSEQAANECATLWKMPIAAILKKSTTLSSTPTLCRIQFPRQKKAVDKAIASLDVLPDSEVKEAMIQLAKESLARVS